MTPEPIDTYLGMYRKRSCFSQEELAFLLGSMSGTSTSRHERGMRIPHLRNVFMYEMVCGVFARDIFEPLWDEVQEIVELRAKGLIFSLEKQRPTPKRDQKLAVLNRILEAIEAQKVAHSQP